MQPTSGGWSSAERIGFLLIVGDAFARPLVDELARQQYDLSHLTVVLSGGAPLSAHLKDELLAQLPSLVIVDGLGSSEAGGQLSLVTAGSGATTGTFPPSEGNHVLSAALDRQLRPGEAELGWLAKSGRTALGYLNDRDKTRRTYPTIGGVRFAVPGDRACLRADGSIELHGRDAVTITSAARRSSRKRSNPRVKAARGRLRLRRGSSAERALGSGGGRGRPDASRPPARR